MNVYLHLTSYSYIIHQLLYIGNIFTGIFLVLNFVPIPNYINKTLYILLRLMYEM